MVVGHRNAVKGVAVMHLASCAHCTGRTGDERGRRRQLHLLTLLEHPNALPAEFALRLARELLALADHQYAFRCEAVEEIIP
jgi:hypothetical protein